MLEAAEAPLKGRGQSAGLELLKARIDAGRSARGNITSPYELRLSGRADLRGADRLAMPKKITTPWPPRRRFVGTRKAAIDVLPVVHHRSFWWKREDF
jgi:hypothetical protein